jgi:hypothetical protein
MKFFVVFLASGAGGYLRIVAPDMAEGDYVEIQCEGASPEDEGRIQWFFNNRVCIHCFSIRNKNRKKILEMISKIIYFYS